MTLFDTARIGSGVPVGAPLAGPVIVGLDLSLTATGVAGNAGGGWAEVIKPPTKMRGHERLAHILVEIERFILGADLVAVEGPSFGSTGNAFHQLAGQWWLVTHMLWDRGIPTAVVPPSARAKYATGKGNAGKDLVLVEVARRFPWFTGDNNVADAAVIAAMAADHYGSPMMTMPALHRAALTAVEWPDLGGGPHDRHL